MTMRAPASATAEGIAEITRRLESVPALPVHLRWATVIGGGCFLDSFTTLMVAAALPVLVQVLHIDYAKAGVLMSASFFGMFIGAIALGAASERWGRRTIFTGSVMTFGALSIIAAFAWSFESLFLIRFCQGVGLGGAVPVAAALATECLPASSRGKMFSFTYGLLFALGFFVTPLAGLGLIATFGPDAGWRALFALAGIALPFGFVARFLLPESPRWLAANGNLPRARLVLDGLEAAALARGTAVKPVSPSAAIPHKITRFSEAFSSEYVGRTLLIWLLFSTIYFMQYGLNGWLPTLYVKIGGLQPQQGLALTVGNGAVTLAAQVLFGLSVDRIGRRTWFIAGFGLSLLGIVYGVFALAVLHLTAWPVLFSAAVMMTAGTGVNSGLIYLYATELFPTRMRSWSTSTGSAAGRAGSIVAPLVIGALLNLGLGLVSLFVLLGVVCAIGLWAVLSFAIETKQRTLEEIST